MALLNLDAPSSLIELPIRLFERREIQRQEIIAIGVCLVMLLIGLVLFLLPSSKPKTAGPIGQIQLQTTTAKPKGLSEGKALNALFDQSKLPPTERLKPIASTQNPKARPDPAPDTALRRYRYLGGVKTPDIGVALFSDGNHQISLDVGENLAGFTLQGFDEGQATFSVPERTNNVILMLNR